MRAESLLGQRCYSWALPTGSLPRVAHHLPEVPRPFDSGLEDDGVDIDLAGCLCLVLHVGLHRDLVRPKYEMVCPAH